MSCTLHDVQEPQSASASITTSHFGARSRGAGRQRGGLGERRLREALAPRCRARSSSSSSRSRNTSPRGLVMSSRPTRQPVERSGRGSAGPRRRTALRGGIEQHSSRSPPPWSRARCRRCAARPAADDAGEQPGAAAGVDDQQAAVAELRQGRPGERASACPRRCRSRPRTSSSPASLQQRVELVADARLATSPPRGTRARARVRPRASRRTTSGELRVRDARRQLGERARKRLGRARHLVDDAPHAVAANSVTAMSPARQPRSTAAAPTASPSSSSAKQNVYLPGLPSVARSTSPGRPPPTLRITSCSARPIVALARLPWPERVARREFMPIAPAIGPFTTTSGPENHVVASRPCMLNSSVHAASTAASTTGRYSGRQPAITALIATFSTVHVDEVGRDDGRRSRRVARGAARASAARARPSAAPAAGRRSSRARTSPRCSSSPAPSSTRRAARPVVAVRIRSRSMMPGSRCLAPQPGRNVGQLGAEHVEAGDALPLGAAPAIGALHLAPVVEAEQRRHGVDAQPERDVEPVSSIARPPSRGSSGRPG